MEKSKQNIAVVALLILCAQAINGVPLVDFDVAKTFIYGGEEAALGEFRWMVSIQTIKHDFSGYVHICGGTLVSSTKIVTAAHCVETLGFYPHGYTRIVAGAHRITVQEPSQQIRTIHASGIHVHHLYNKEVSVYDVAVIELPAEEAFYATERVSWAVIPPANMPSEGICQIAGWGSTRDLISSDVLLRADVPIVSKYNCRNIYPGFHTASQICAGRDEGGVDTCMGDTGGAIICNNTGYRFFAGVSVGGGTFCGTAGKPGIYAEVSHIISWINNPTEGFGEVEQVVDPFFGEANH